MKRILSVLIVTVLFFTSISSGFVAVAKTIPPQTQLNAFADDLLDMIRKYDVEDAEAQHEFDILDKMTEKFPIVYSEHSYSSFVTNSEYGQDESAKQYKSAADFGLSADAFDLKRLIVKSAYDIDYYGAIDCVSGYQNLNILQYDSVEKTAEEYEYYL